MEILSPDKSRVAEGVSGRSNDSRALDIFSIGDVWAREDFLSGTTGRTLTLLLGGGKWPRVKDMETVGVGVSDWLEYPLEGDISPGGLPGEEASRASTSIESWEGVVALEVEGEARDSELP